MTTTASTSNSPASSIISALGAGSGIDMAALAANLAEAQYAGRLQQLSSKSDALDAKISTASKLKSQISQLASALGDRVRTGDLAPAPVISNGSVASVSRSANATKPAGSYSLEVTALATSQTLTGPAYAASTSTVGSGTLTLRFGSVSSGSFTADGSRDAVDITIPAGATLADVAAAINGAGAGVSAYVANGADGARLVLKGAQGAQNGFVLEASETAGDEGLAALAWEPATGASSRMLASAGDAQFSLDGIAMTSSSNTIANAAPGISLKLTGTNAGAPATISFSDPTASITAAMTDITGALNEILSSLAEATNPLGGDLARDDGARSLRRQLSTLGSTVIMPNAPAGAPKTLTELGLLIGRDGTFSFDASKLSAAIAKNPEGVAAMFTNGLHGVYATVYNISLKAGDSKEGSGALGRSIDIYRAQLAKVSDENSKIADKQEALRARLTSQFSATDTAVNASKSTLSFLQAQIAIWTKSNN